MDEDDYLKNKYYACIVKCRQDKTVDNCFIEGETAQSKEPKKRFMRAARRLCDGGGI